MSQLWVVVHEHRGGDDLYLLISDLEPKEQEALKRLDLALQLGDRLAIRGPITDVVDLDGRGRRLQVGRPWQGLLR